MTSYNYARFLPEALDAVTAQLGDGMELIVIDDASTDGSHEILANYARHFPSIRLVHNEANLGVHATVNLALVLAKGRFICFAAADDRILPGMLRHSHEMLLRHPEAAFCTSPVRYVNESGESWASWPGPQRPDAAYLPPAESLALMRRYGFWFVTGGSLFRLDLLREAGGYDLDLGHLADSFLSTRLALRYGFCLLPEPQAEVRYITEGYSGNARASLEASAAARDAAVQRMRAEPELFPVGFVSQWEELFDFLDFLQTWKLAVRRRQLDFLRLGGSRLKDRKSLADPLFASVLRVLSLLELFVLGAWGLFRLAGNPLLRPYVTWKKFKPFVRWRGCEQA